MLQTVMAIIRGGTLPRYLPLLVVHQQRKIQALILMYIVINRAEYETSYTFLLNLLYLITKIFTDILDVET